MKKDINETASAGGMGGGSIAVVHGGSGDPDTPTRLKSFMKDFLKRTKNRLEFKLVNGKMSSLTFAKLDEASNDLSGIFSQLKNSETQSYEKRTTVTYGVEDDNGNLMKITLPKDQGDDFENRLSREMAEIEDFKSTGHKGKDISMAELVFDLKDEFKVLDVEFPTIPSDTVYNADKVSKGIEEEGPDDEFGSDDLGSSEMGDAEGGEQPPTDGETPQEFGDDKDGEPMPPDADDDSVENFGSDGDGSDSSILASVMDMLKATAEAEKAKADAEAEKARAKQAEYSAKSAQIEMGKQEEIIKMEADMDAQKDKEKEAKQMAELAKHKYTKSKSFSEGFKFSSLMTKVVEFDDNTTVQTLAMQKREINAKYRPDPKDDQGARMEKAKQKRLALQALQIDRKRVASRDSQMSKDELENAKAEKTEGDTL